MRRKRYIDYFNNKVPKCPYCSEDQPDYEEYVSYEDQGLAEIDCYCCGKKYECCTEITYGYTTVGNCDVHKLYMTNGHSYTCQVCAAEYYPFHLAGGKYPKLTEEQYEILEEQQ